MEISNRPRVEQTVQWELSVPPVFFLPVTNILLLFLVSPPFFSLTCFLK
jgi:hypothetical protein